MATFSERVGKSRQSQRLHGCALLIGLLVLFAAFSVYFISQNSTVQRSYIYPYKYRGLVEHYSHLYGVDSNLAASVILAESKFDDEVHSHRGAIGLMQLMPDTAEWIAGELEDENFTVQALHDPELNIRYGIWYLASLEEEFHYNDALALAAYNAGRGNVQEWMNLYGWDKDFDNINEIPYLETRAYVAKVLAAKRKYRELYREE